jgi:hypothetical protein
VGRRASWVGWNPGTFGSLRANPGAPLKITNTILCRALGCARRAVARRRLGMELGADGWERRPGCWAARRLLCPLIGYALLAVPLGIGRILSLRATAHPLHTRSNNIFGTSISEATMRPNPRSRCTSRAASRSTRARSGPARGM